MRELSIDGCADPIVMTFADPVARMDSHGGVRHASSGPAADGACDSSRVGGGGTGDPKYIINCCDRTRWMIAVCRWPRGETMMHASRNEKAHGS